jgi:hypothetical protein
MISTFDESYANPKFDTDSKSVVSSCQMIVTTTLTSHLEKDCSGPENQDSIFNYLSWFYVQQKSFRKPSFKKAIYKRNSITVKYCQFSKSRS